MVQAEAQHSIATNADPGAMRSRSPSELYG